MAALLRAEVAGPMKKTMRILHVTPGNLYGGVETFLVALAQFRQLCPEMVPEFAVCFPGRFEQEVQNAGCPVHDIGKSRVSRPWSVLRARKSLRSILLAGSFDLLVCHQPWTQGLFGSLARSVGIGYVAYFHLAASNGWVDWLAGWTRPDLVIAPSSHSLETCRSVFPTTPGHVLNYPIPPEMLVENQKASTWRQAIRDELGVLPSEVVILQASRVERWKGADLVLRALGRIREVPGWRFWLAGGVQRPHERALYDEFRRIAIAEGINDRVSFLGQRSDVKVLMRGADIYCQGNRGPEGFSLAFLEASCSAIPIVTPDLGGAREMIDEATGFLTPPGDVVALAEGLRTLVTDSNRRVQMGSRAREKAFALCNPEQQFNRLRDLFASAISPSSRVSSLTSGVLANDR